MEVHSIWIIWTSNLQECKGAFIVEDMYNAGTIFSRGLKHLNSCKFLGVCLGVPNHKPQPHESSQGRGLASAFNQLGVCLGATL